ncbi:class I SAM-dependent methyltransferase [Streptomyces sp. BK340]|uniref:class I SAM-dependent methyltransferase n=1 Tax=Streptomyces sp. BK340 TaxID=2572903 RepID=UPI00119F5566|nr:class I SAM-dependent methyltransferase [Streptomyces sp. BK340]TVZ90517.1 methyltransferase family protein [Streptomyces sp. BK340]
MSTPPDSCAADTAGHQTTSASEFDRLFGSEGQTGDSAFGAIARLVDPDLPPDLDLFSFLCADLLHHIAQQLDLHPGQLLTDLGCGRGGPGLWLASHTHAALIGIDFSPVAIAQARRRATPLPVDAAFAVADLAGLPLADQCVDRAVSLDALQYAPDRSPPPARPCASSSPAAAWCSPAGARTLPATSAFQHGTGTPTGGVCCARRASPACTAPGHRRGTPPTRGSTAPR